MPFFLEKLTRQLKRAHLAGHLEKVDRSRFLVEEVDALDSHLVVLLSRLGHFVCGQGHVSIEMLVLCEQRMVKPVDVMPLIWLVALSYDDVLETASSLLLLLVSQT